MKNPSLRTFRKIVGNFPRLDHFVTIDGDVDPVVLVGSSDSDTERVPDSRQPNRVKVIIARDVKISEYFAPDPLLTLKLFNIILSAALIEEIARLAYVATQQGILPVRNDSLERIIIRGSGEVVGEEPGADSQLGDVHQGGVHQLSTAVFSWQ